MVRLVFPAIFSGLIVIASANAQATDVNPGHTPDAVLDNHRPLLSKRDKAPTSRTVTGKVVDDTGQPLGGALVTLTDTKTHEKTTVFTKKDGRYNFEDVSFTIDYQLQARYKDLMSDTRKLSQYDHTANVVRILEVQPADTVAPAKTEAKSERK